MYQIQVHNSSVKTVSVSPEADIPIRRRTMSQPGPVSGSMMTATAGRRRRPPRSVMYADLESAVSKTIMSFILTTLLLYIFFSI